MFSNKINSYNKSNIVFIAMGNYQIEFFTIENVRYFAIYIHTGSGGYGSEIVLDLNQVKLSKHDENLKLTSKNSTFKFNFTLKNNKINGKIVQYLWHWLPLQAFKGEISKPGISILKSELGKYV